MNSEKDRQMIDSKDYVVDVKKWKEGGRYIPWTEQTQEERSAMSAVTLLWNERTSGAGNVVMTLLYALRAHKRGRIHCHDMDLAAQSAFLQKAAPFLQRFLVPKPEPKQMEAPAEAVA